MILFTKRNLYVFFRDRSAVFFSLLSSFIIIGLYFLFLGDTYANNFKDIANNPRSLVDNWVMAGLIATTSVTATMGSFGIMVNDNHRGIVKDFYSSPINRNYLVAGYVLASLIIGFIMSVVTFIFAEIYIVIGGGTFLSISSMIKVLLLILLTTFTNTTMIFFITSFFSSNNGFSTASTIIGTLIGFLTGIYIPVGFLPEAVQWIVKIFPTSHGAVLLRQVMMESSINENFANIPTEYLNEFKHIMGVSFELGNRELKDFESICILVGFALLFFVLSAIRISRKKEK